MTRPSIDRSLAELCTASVERAATIEHGALAVSDDAHERDAISIDDDRLAIDARLDFHAVAGLAAIDGDLNRLARADRKVRGDIGRQRFWLPRPRARPRRQGATALTRPLRRERGFGLRANPRRLATLVPDACCRWNIRQGVQPLAAAAGAAAIFVGDAGRATGGAGD